MVEILSGEEGDPDMTHDPDFSRLVIVVNARPDAHSLQWPSGEPAKSTV